MRLHLYGSLLVGALAAVFAGVSGLAQDAQPDEQPGVDVQTRGPVHEAYAAPTSLQPVPGPIIPKQPPDPIEEMPPDEKPAGDNVEWLPGYWAWDDDRNDYLWVSGIWRVPPPNRQWVPGSWHQVEGGWQWANGFWMTLQQGEVQYLPPPPPPPPTALPPQPG